MGQPGPLCNLWTYESPCLQREHILALVHFVSVWCKQITNINVTPYADETNIFLKSPYKYLKLLACHES